jgi:hypothetical protein
MKTTTAQAAYIDAAAKISGLVSCLQVYADKLHDADPAAVNWGHVGDLERVRVMMAALLEITKPTTRSSEN